MSTAREVAGKCLPTAHPAIKAYVDELEKEVRALRRQLRSVSASCSITQDRLIEAAGRARELEREHACETDDWDEADGSSVNYLWPKEEAHDELARRINQLQIGLAAVVRTGPNPDSEAPF